MEDSGEAGGSCCCAAEVFRHPGHLGYQFYPGRAGAALFLTKKPEIRAALCRHNGGSTHSPMSTEPAGVKECWEAAVSADTPYWRDHLRTLEDEAAEMNRTVGHLLKLSQGYTKAAEAMAIARKELMQGVLTAATESFQHADLSSDASAKQVAEMGSLFDQMIVAHDMERQQVQSLLVEPLQAMLDDPKGLASGSRLYAAYNSMSHDFYEALSEFLSLEGEGANAMAARAHAKTQAKAAAKVGSAAMSAAASKVGTGFGFLSRMAQNKLGDLGATLPAPGPRRGLGRSLGDVIYAGLTPVQVLCTSGGYCTQTSERSLIT